MQQQKAVVGIDLGATHIRICVMDLAKRIRTTHKQRTAEMIGDNFLAKMRHFIQQYGSSYAIQKIVIGLPAAISKDRTTVLSVPNLRIETVDLTGLVPYLQKVFACQVQLERDVNLQLLYDVEHFQLAHQYVLGIYLGTGVGFSVYRQGKIFVGQHGVAGELGHIPFGDSHKQCRCGNYGCLETLCSGKALSEWYNSRTRPYPFTALFSHALQTAFIRQYLHHLAKAIATVINLFDPDAVVLGGGVIDMQDFPYQRLTQDGLSMVRKPLPYEQVRFYQAQSSDVNGAIGAALQAML